MIYVILSYAGSKLLMQRLPSMFDGSAKVNAESQDDSKATLAPKARLPFSLIFVSVSLRIIHWNYLNPIASLVHL